MKKEERKLECFDFDLFSKDALKIYGDSLLITTPEEKKKMIETSASQFESRKKWVFILLSWHL